MKNVLALLILLSGIHALPVYGQGVNYTSRNFTIAACKMFGNDAYIAASSYAHGEKLPDILELIEQAPLAENKKLRMFQAVQFVWKNQLDNPVLAKSIALGLCLKPKHLTAPMDEPFFTSPRTSKEFY
ncbi:MAG: hypothetical protein RIB78_09700 [Gammaproteobacteria bacterium]